MMQPCMVAGMETYLTLRQAENTCIAWGSCYRTRDEVVRMAFASGVSKIEIHRLTGIARTTIDRILAEPEPAP